MSDQDEHAGLTEEAPTAADGGGFGTPEQQQAAQALRDAMQQVRPLVRLPGRGGLGRMIFAMTLGRFLRVPRLRGRRLRAFGFGLVIAVLSLTTCSFGVDPASLTASYGPPVEGSTEAATRLFEKGASALQGLADTRTLRLAVTDAEATSALSLGMMLPELLNKVERIPPEEIRGATDLEALRERIWQEEREARAALLASLPFWRRLPLLLDPQLRTGSVQVRFEESGEVVVAGFVQAWRFRQPAMFVVAPRAQGGELELDFVRGRLGRLPAPEFVFDLLGDLVASVVLLGQEYGEITELSVEGGRLQLAGRVRG